MTLRTVNYALRYPELTDTPNGPAQVEALAEDTDAALLAVAAADAALVNALRPNLTQTTLAYTPTFGMATFAGAVAGRYGFMGKWCFVNAAMLASAGVSLGTGAITVSLPVSTNSSGNQFWVGRAVIQSGTGLIYTLPVVVGAGSSTVNIYAYLAPAKGQLDTPGNQGVVLAAGGTVSIDIAYEIP